jgi:dynactin complex subunit
MSKPRKRGNVESLRKTQSRKSFDRNWIKSYQHRKKERIGTSSTMRQVRMFYYNSLTDVVDTKLY